MNYEEIHNWLMAALPATSERLLLELERLHRYLPKSYVGFPRKDVELIDVLKTLRDRGMVAQCSPHPPEDMLAAWRWMSGETAKVNQQKELFA